MKQKRRIASASTHSLFSFADNLVIAIGAYLTGGESQAASLKKAIDTCSELIGQLASGAKPATHERALSQQEVDLVNRGLRALERAASGQTDVAHDDLIAFQQFLVQHGMPEWKSRMNDFRQRRLKRGLRRYG